MNKLTTIESAFSAIIADEKLEAKEILFNGFPHEPLERYRRSYTPTQSMGTFIDDGFIDRYSGEKLLYPGALRIMSLRLPEEFPYQAHWKTAETHMAYWYFYPTIDHIDPIARGGTNAKDNLVTTSQLRNSAKSHWLLRELGWKLFPSGDLSSWDGLLHASLAYVDKHPSLLKDTVLRKWHLAAKEITET